MEKSALNIAALPLGIFFFLVVLNFEFKAPMPPANYKQYVSEIKFSRFNDINIHCGAQHELEACFSAAQKHSERFKTMVLIGNSQLHTINQYKPSDQTVAFFLHEMLRDRGVFLITISYPNINFNEIAVLIKAIGSSLKVTDYVISATFDDTRDSSIRREIKLKSPIDKAHDENTLLSNLESNILSILQKNVPGWERRETWRIIIINKIHEFRNAAFNITPSTVRKKLPPQYQANMNALKGILANSVVNSSSVTLMIPPIRNDFPQPYIKSEYVSFKQEIRALAENSKNSFIDLGSSVPNKLWGMRAEKGVVIPDFMHFKSDAHLRFAQNLNELL